MHPNDDRIRGINMSASSLVYLKTAEVSRVRRPEPGSVRAKKSRWRTMSFFRSRPPTTFQLSLALHMFGAERYGALDWRRHPFQLFQRTMRLPLPHRAD
jgi:hypothetical protein